MLATYVKRLDGFALDRYAVLARVWKHPVNSGSKLKALYDYVLWNAVRFTMRARHVVSLPCGLELILGSNENYGTAVYVHTLSDFEELLFLAHLLREDDLFLDVGANVGMYSILAAGITRAKVIALEPVPHTYQSLNKNIRLNNLTDAIIARQAAAGSTSGSLIMTADEGGLAHVVDDEASGKTVRVPLATLDDIVAEQRPSVMKMDVEGFELHALRGASKVLRDPTLRVIVIELQDTTLNRYGTSVQDVTMLLQENDFSPYSYDPFRRKLLAGIQRKQLNQLFVRLDDDIVQRLASGPKIPLPGYPDGV